jgi:hypothetical protein
VQPGGQEAAGVHSLQRGRAQPSDGKQSVLAAGDPADSARNVPGEPLKTHTLHAFLPFCLP